MEETDYGFCDEWKFTILFPGTIIDLETSALEPQDGDILTFGYFTSGVAKVCQLAKTDKDSADKFKQSVIETMKFLPRPFYAYNASFEEKWLNTKFDIDLFDNWKKIAGGTKKEGHKWCYVHRWVKNNEENVCQFCQRPLWNDPKWPRAEELVSLPHKYFGIEIEAMGKDIPPIWYEYKQTGNRELLNKIVYHNLYDIIREACLLLWDETVTSYYAGMLGEEKGKPRRRF